MSETFKEIKDSIPEINSQKVEDLSNELDRILAIKRIFQSRDGKELLIALKNNCAIALRKAVYAAKNGQDTVPFILDYAANIDLLSTSQDISMEEEIRSQLDESVKEAYRS